MAQKNARTEPSWADVMYWIEGVERDHNVRCTISCELRPAGGGPRPSLCVVVRCRTLDGSGNGPERVVRTGTFPTAGAKSLTALALNLLHQCDNQLHWLAAKAEEESPSLFRP